MNPAAFGATRYIPLADYPFRRSPLSVADAERELQVQRSLVLTDVDGVPESAEIPEEVWDALAENVRQSRENAYTAVVRQPPWPVLSRPFWQRLAWLRQESGY